VTEFGILKSGPLPPNTSAQLAELVALTEALRLSKEQTVNIYTDSKYAFLSCMLIQPSGRKGEY
jgi:ribonuclease HI